MPIPSSSGGISAKPGAPPPIPEKVTLSAEEILERAASLKGSRTLVLDSNVIAYFGDLVGAVRGNSKVVSLSK